MNSLPRWLILNILIKNIVYNAEVPAPIFFFFKCHSFIHVTNVLRLKRSE